MTVNNWPLVISVVGLALSAGVLILLLPTLFDPSGDLVSGWLLAVLAGLAVMFAIGTRRWRPSAARPESG